MTGQEWRGSALCAQVGPEAFFVEKGGDTRIARQLCAACEVTDECLRYALDTREEFGIWGGTSPRQRKKMRRTERHRTITAPVAPGVAA